MRVAKKGNSKTATARKTPAGSESNSHKRAESERIANDIAEYQKAGGKIEKLGVTRVLQTVTPAKNDEVARAVPQARSRAR